MSDQPASSHSVAPPTPKFAQEVGTVLYDFKPINQDELTVYTGDRLTLVERVNNDWAKCRTTDGLEGLVPTSYVDFTAAPPSYTPQSRRQSSIPTNAASDSQYPMVMPTPEPFHLHSLPSSPQADPGFHHRTNSSTNVNNMASIDSFPSIPTVTQQPPTPTPSTPQSFSSQANPPAYNPQPASRRRRSLFGTPVDEDDRRDAPLPTPPDGSYVFLSMHLNKFTGSVLEHLPLVHPMTKSHVRIPSTPRYSDNTNLLSYRPITHKMDVSFLSTGPSAFRHWFRTDRDSDSDSTPTILTSHT